VAVALAESCFQNGLGAKVKLDGKIRKDALLFGESQSRIVISTREPAKVKDICKKLGIPVSEIGKVTKNKLIIERLLDLPVAKLRSAWEGAIPKALQN
jgi:phosphoribosylformylglycinamidine synthase